MRVKISHMIACKILSLRSRIFRIPRGMLALGRMIRKDRFGPAHEGLSFLFFNVDVELESACVDVREKKKLCMCPFDCGK